MTGSPLRTVVGAGPAGLAAAITLARAGQRVGVLERHTSVGQRFHDDMQGLENWSSGEHVLDRLRRLGIEPDFPHRGFAEVTVYGPRLRPVTARFRRPLFYLVRRGRAAGALDTALLRQARDAGADVRFDEPARTAGPGTIVATGPESADGIVAGLVFRTTLPDQAHTIVHPTLGACVAPGGPPVSRSEEPGGVSPLGAGHRPETDAGAGVWSPGPPPSPRHVVRWGTDCETTVEAGRGVAPGAGQGAGQGCGCLRRLRCRSREAPPSRRHGGLGDRRGVAWTAGGLR